MNDGTENLTYLLAEFISNLDFSDLSQKDKEQLDILILDHIAVCLSGADRPWIIALKKWASAYRNTGPCILFGDSVNVSPAIAAMINASTAHAQELDDTHDESMTHPGAVVIAVALAVGTEQQSSGKEVLAAIVAGYEIIARIGIATNAAEVIEDGFHPTALFGGFGAVAAAAKLYGLEPSTICSAWGLMLSLAGGSMQFSQDAKGALVKRLHAGYGAQNGINATQLARLGIQGPSNAFDGVYGLCRLFGRNPDTSRLAGDFHEEFQIHAVSLKSYPCCRPFHSTIDALRDLTNNFTLDTKGIEKIIVGGPRVLVTQHMMLRPESEMAAQYSLPYAIGACLVDGPYSYESFAVDRLEDERIISIVDRVEAVEDEFLQSKFPKHFGSWVELVLAGGITRRCTVLDSYGTATNPMSVEAVIDKCNSLTQNISFRPETERILDEIFSLPSERDVTNFVSLFQRN